MVIDIKAIRDRAESIKHLSVMVMNKHEVSALCDEIERLRSTINEFHHAIKDAGWHPGRTDDLLTDIIRAKGDEIERLRDETGQLQEQNRWLDEKLAEAEKDAFTKSAQICQDWIEDHSKADNCTYNDCDMVAAVTDVMNEIKGIMK